MPNTISHWINNDVYAGSSTKSAPVTNPATGEVTGEVALGSVEDARAVIDAAAAAFPAWRDTSLAKRTQILFTFRELLNSRKGELAEIITSEHGKVVSDALGEVSRGQGKSSSFACGIPHLLKGGFTENASTQGRRLLHPPTPRPGRRHLPVQLPRHGADVVLSHRHRRGQHRGSQAQREGPHRRAVAGQPVGPKPVCPQGSSTCSRATRPSSTNC